MAYSFDLDLTGRRMLSIEQRWSRSDTIDVAYRRISEDFGATWSPPEEYRTGERRADGMLRRHPRGPWVHPKTGETLECWLEAVLPNDDPLEGLSRWQIMYRWRGKVAAIPREVLRNTPAMLGDMTCRPILRGDGAILLPVSLSPLRDGKIYNPGGGYTWHDAAVLVGRISAVGIDWTMTEVIEGDPSRSTRGWPEPAIATLSGGRILMVMRGSNDRSLDLPGVKWYAISNDGARTWSRPMPWSDTSGRVFYSPSSCSQLLAHSSGRLFWLGNRTNANPKGNLPRYPMVLTEVDLRTGLVVAGSERVIDDLAPGEDPLLTLSNFYAREDRRAREICLHMTRLFARNDGWEGDAMLYRIPV